MGVTLRLRLNTGGKTSSYRLDINHNGRRWHETIKQLKHIEGKNLSTSERQLNKEAKRLAEDIKNRKIFQLVNEENNIPNNLKRKILVTDWFDEYYKNYTKKDARNILGVINRFKEFIQEENLQRLFFNDLTSLLLEDFIEYLESKSIGEGARSYYSRFKKMLRYAQRLNLVKADLLLSIEKKPRGSAKKKDALTTDEIQALSIIPISNRVVRNGFLFSCLTGLRWCDLKSLKWENIDLEKKVLSVIQQKTNIETSLSLNEAAIKIVEEMHELIINDYVFNLPSNNGANKLIKKWINDAKINKKITWHNARHSFGTNLIFKGNDIYSTSKLMGHSSLKYTDRYIKASDDMKRKGTDLININLQ
jgi:hypothetical protein